MTTEEEIQKQLALMDELFGAKGPNGNIAIPLKTWPGFAAYYSKYCSGNKKGSPVEFVRIEPLDMDRLKAQNS